jgi:DNA transposition AAA+ family ATPase
MAKDQMDGYSEKIHAEFVAFLKESGFSQAAAARGLNVSSSAVNGYINRNYPGDVPGLEKKVKTWLAAQYRKRDKPNIPFVETGTVLDIWKAIERAQDNEDISIVVGDAGTGKTAAAAQYAERSSQAVVVEMGSICNRKSVVIQIAKAMDISIIGSTAELMDEIIDRLRDTGKCLVIDEADRLNYATLDSLRRISDLAHCGLVLIGVTEFASKLKNKVRDFNQISSRVGTLLMVKNLAEDDARKLLDASGRKYDKEAFAALYKAAGGSVRAYLKAVYNACRVLKENKLGLIDADVVEAALAVSMR